MDGEIAEENRALQAKERELSALLEAERERLSEERILSARSPTHRRE